MGYKYKSRNSKVESEPPKKTITEEPIKISIFEQKSRLDLIDAAITTLKIRLRPPFSEGDNITHGKGEISPA
jgi:hypothetical protein